MLFWVGTVRHRLSTNQIVRCFKLKKLENSMRDQVDFLPPLKLQMISYILSNGFKKLLANQFAEFLTFDLFVLLILIPGVNCYIVLVNSSYIHSWLIDSLSDLNPAGNDILKVGNRNTRTRCEICSKLTIKTPGVFIVNFEHISHLVPVFLLLTSSR